MADEKQKVFITQTKGISAGGLPAAIRYATYFRIFGLIAGGAEQYFKPDGVKIKGSSRLSRMYCRLVCTMLWFFTVRSFVLMFIWDRNVQLILGDITGYWNDYRLYYLMPQLFFSLHNAITCTNWQSKESDLGWLVPFLSARLLQSNRTGSFRVSSYKFRVYFGILFNLVMVAFVTSSVAVVYYGTAARNLDDHLFKMWIPWLVIQILWFFYMTGITFFTMTYFNVITIMLSRRFGQVTRDIEDLAEKDNGASGSKNGALTTLYFEHNEVCELVDESNLFWQSYVFFTYMSYIPCACYALYNVFFAEFDDLLGPVTWTAFGHTIFLVGFISISASKVAAQAHAPYSALHSLSLLHLPIEQEVNMSTFLHRVRGPTIGFSCLDLFVITNATISNTVAAVASYFLIVADFSRSTITAAKAAEVAAAAEAMLANGTVTTTMMAIGAESM